MLPSHDPLLFTRLGLIVSQNQAVWATKAGTYWVKSAVDVTSCTIHVQTNYSYSDDTIRPNTNTLFGPLFDTEANIRYIPSFFTFTRNWKLAYTAFSITFHKFNSSLRCSLQNARILTITAHMTSTSNLALLRCYIAQLLGRRYLSGTLSNQLYKDRKIAKRKIRKVP